MKCPFRTKTEQYTYLSKLVVSTDFEECYESDCPFWNRHTRKCENVKVVVKER